MVKLRYTGLLFFIILAFTPTLQAGEMLTGVARAVTQRRAQLRPLSLTSTTLDTLPLPFFDDFSKQANAVPDPKKWTDSYTLINNTYGVNQPTMGVATFDALDATGRVYGHIVQSPPRAADTLSSMPIDLQPTDVGVYLSFAYQPKGLSDDMPEPTDSLVLQFLADSTWISVWHVAPNANNDSLQETYYLQEPHKKTVSSSDITSTFFKVMIKVDDARFLYSGFRFRFMNYVTRGKEEVDGKLGDCDVWHLDLVYLNSNRAAADTVLSDVAIANPVSRLLKEYQSMPWQHLKNSPAAQREQLVNATGTGATITFNLSNLNNTSTGFVGRHLLTCVAGATSSSTETYGLGTIFIQADTIRPFSYPLPLGAILNTPQADADSVAFEIKTIINDYLHDLSLEEELRTNDTGIFRQNFYTYYAYDDGSAENGYGIYGASPAGAKAAVKYFSYLRDTLSGIYMYFNNTQDSGNIEPFKLAVWSDKNGMPGDAIYLIDSSVYAQFDSLNSFIYYKLKYPVVVEGAFYVGWVQQSTATLNVGFDRNNKVSGKMYISDNGYSWGLSRFDGSGSLMIRPSFAKTTFDPYTSVNKNIKTIRKVAVYPNPVSSELHLMLPDELREKNLQVEIFNLAGQKVMHEIAATATINVARLPHGTYFICLSENGKTQGIARFVKF